MPNVIFVRECTVFVFSFNFFFAYWFATAMKFAVLLTLFHDLHIILFPVCNTIDFTGLLIALSNFLFFKFYFLLPLAGSPEVSWMKGGGGGG